MPAAQSAGVSEALVSVGFRIGVENRIDQGVRALRGFDGAIQRGLAAFVHAIGQQDERLASLLLLHQLIRGKKHRVIQCGTSTFVAAVSSSSSFRRPFRAARTLRPRHVQLVQRHLQFLVIRSQVLQQLRAPIEVDDEGLVLIDAHELVEKRIAGDPLLLDQPALAQAGIDQQAKRQRQIGLAE